MDTRATPLRWDVLPRYGREAVRLLNMAVVGLPCWPYPGSKACAAVGEILGESLGGRLRDPLIVTPAPCVATTFSDFAASAPAGISAALIVGKKGDRGLAWIEADLAYRAVDRLLGGPGASPMDLSEPTGVETGLLTYLILRVLRGIHRLGGAEDDTVVRLARILRGALTADDHVTPGAPCIVVAVKVRLAGHEGEVHIALPERTLSTVATGRVGGVAIPETLGGAAVVFRADVGTTELTAGDLAALEPGDVIVPELLHVAAREDGVAGGCVLRPEGGGACGIRARFVSAGERLRAEVIDFVVDGLPERGSTEETSMDQNEPVPDAPEEETPDAEPHEEPTAAPPPIEPTALPTGRTGEASVMVNEIPMNVAIEMGRVKLSVAEVAALVPGQILDLKRRVGSPVDLVVGGRVIAQGDLIEIEGELGVRIGGIAR